MRVPSPVVRFSTVVAVATALVFGAAACGDDADDVPSTGEEGASTPVDDTHLEGVPPEVADHADDWPTAGQDYDNTRTAVGSGITAETVDGLAVGWRTQLPDAGSLSTVPLVVGDTIYLQGGSGQILSLDRQDGAVAWSSDPTGFNFGPFGVAVGDGRVYGLDGTDGVLAVDLADGTPVWSTDITATDTTGVDIQPVVVADTVIASSVPVSIEGIYTPGDRGVVHALNAGTGEVRWTFDTVQGDLWGHPEVNSGGGAWYPPVVDLERGKVFVGTANPAPFPGTEEFPNGSSRPGPNLYSNSVVALDLDTGELDWFHQVVPHDLFDRDQVHTLMADLPGGGVVLVSAGKSGIVVGLDPDAGTVLWEAEVGRHENDDMAELDGPTTIVPGTYGGVLTPPATADGVVYLPTVNAPEEMAPDRFAYFGAPLGEHDGELAAVDAETGRALWSTMLPGDPDGGAAVVNDLVFTALLDGTVMALRRDDGEIVWSLDAGGGVNGWMSIVDDEVFVPVGNAAPAELLSLRLP